jgi:hypothetical protein
MRPYYSIAKIKIDFVGFILPRLILSAARLRVIFDLEMELFLHYMLFSVSFAL